MRDGTEVAVKELPLNAKQSVDDFINEVQLVHSLQHKNLVKLRGCSVNGSSRLLVYEYVENKSLARALFGKWLHTFFLVLLYWSSTFLYLLQPYGNESMWSYWRSCNQYQDQRNSKIKRFHRLRAKIWTQGLYTRFWVQGMRKWTGAYVAITFPTKSLQSPLKKKLLVWEPIFRLGSNLESKRKPHQGVFSIPIFLDTDPDVNPPVSRLHVLNNVGRVYRWTQQYQYPI